MKFPSVLVGLSVASASTAAAISGAVPEKEIIELFSIIMVSL
jgi:hypothetical protein